MQVFPAGVMGAIPGMASFASWMMRKKIFAAGIPALDELMEIAQLERGSSSLHAK